MDIVKFEVSLVLDAPASISSVNSLREQLMELISKAVNEKQIEVPDAEIYYYDVTIDERELGY